MGTHIWGVFFSLFYYYFAYSTLPLPFPLTHYHYHTPLVEIASLPTLPHFFLFLFHLLVFPRFDDVSNTHHTPHNTHTIISSSFISPFFFLFLLFYFILFLNPLCNSTCWSIIGQSLMTPPPHNTILNIPSMVQNYYYIDFNNNSLLKLGWWFNLEFWFICCFWINMKFGFICS